MSDSRISMTRARRDALDDVQLVQLCRRYWDPTLADAFVDMNAMLQEVYAKGRHDALAQAEESHQSAAEAAAPASAVEDYPQRLRFASDQSPWARDLMREVADHLDRLRAEREGEYICKCGIRVTPHRCQVTEGF